MGDVPACETPGGPPLTQGGPSLISLGPAQTRLVQLLGSRFSDGRSPPTLREAVEELGCNRSRVERMLRRLERLGIIRRAAGLARAVALTELGHAILDRHPICGAYYRRLEDNASGTCPLARGHTTAHRWNLKPPI